MPVCGRQRWSRPHVDAGYELAQPEQRACCGASYPATTNTCWQWAGATQAACPLPLLPDCRSLLGVEAPGMAEMVHNCIQARVSVAA